MITSDPARRAAILAEVMGLLERQAPAEDRDLLLAFAPVVYMETPDRVVFGFSDRSAPRLLQFLRAHGPSMAHLSGVRYSGELGRPFHVIDADTVILSLDHPFVPEGRFASLLVRDEALAERLAQGFETLWQKALRDLREVRPYPRGGPVRRA